MRAVWRLTAYRRRQTALSWRDEFHENHLAGFKLQLAHRAGVSIRRQVTAALEYFDPVTNQFDGQGINSGITGETRT